MSKGVLLFAFNTEQVNYYDMAVATSKRVNHFLNLPVTLVTDEWSVPKNPTYTFDNTIITTADKTNKKNSQVWINKGRFQAFEYTPYDETLLLDTDYLINSNALLKTFTMYDDFCCHDTTSWLMRPDMIQETIGIANIKTLWATVVAFRKTNRTKQIFECLEMVQKKYEHYTDLHSIVSGSYRNDYGLTLALDIANGHTKNLQDIIPWNLVHTNDQVRVYKNNDTEFNTEYTVMSEVTKRGKTRTEYIALKDTDFHMLDKGNFMELVK